jgi:thiaminase (transcriptional activator TenA)
MSNDFTSALWQDVADIYAAILAHPFLAGLTGGDLPPDSFAFYVVQDVLFLRRYAQALSIVASRAPDTASTEMFARHAAGIVTAEMSLHQSLMTDLGLDPSAVEAAKEAPTTLAYTSYLLATAGNGSYGEGVGALLPCYWIYWEVGKHLVERGSPNPRYQRWIDTYSGDDYGSDALEVIAATDKLSVDLSPREREQVRRHFRVTSRYEWMFWDMAYHQQAWPV